MSANASNMMTTVQNLDISELDLENNRAQNRENSSDQQQNDMMNISEFVFNHITAETGGT